MFDIGFSEIVVIAVVALIVIGPERLPKTARTLGHLFGRLQRYVNEVKADINREMELDELRKLKHEVETAARDIETRCRPPRSEVEPGVRARRAGAQRRRRGASPAAAARNAPASARAAGNERPPSPRRLRRPPRRRRAAEPPRQASLPGFERG